VWSGSAYLLVGATQVAAFDASAGSVGTSNAIAHPERLACGMGSCAAITLGYLDTVQLVSPTDGSELGTPIDLGNMFPMTIVWIGDRYLLVGGDGTEPPPPTPVFDVRTLTTDGTLGPLVQIPLPVFSPDAFYAARADDRIVIAIDGPVSLTSGVVVLDTQLAVAVPFASAPSPIVDAIDLDTGLLIAWQDTSATISLALVGREGTALDQVSLPILPAAQVPHGPILRLERVSGTEADVLDSILDTAPAIRTNRLRRLPVRVESP
jgi:hypothetical protein